VTLPQLVLETGLAPARAFTVRFGRGRVDTLFFNTFKKQRSSPFSILLADIYGVREKREEPTERDQ
jgi:hypothetical protein